MIRLYAAGQERSSPVAVTLLLELLDFKTNFISASWMIISRGGSESQDSPSESRNRSPSPTINIGSWLVVIDASHTGNKLYVIFLFFIINYY